jgi:hypothetical protein
MTLNLDTLDVMILTGFSSAVGLVLGLMLGIPLAFAIRPWHHRHRPHSLHNREFSGTSLLSKIDVEPMDVVMGRRDAIGVDDATLQKRINTASATVGVEHDASTISAGVRLDHQHSLEDVG